MDVLAHQALGALAAAGRQIAGESGVDGAMSAVADGAAAATRADVAVVRVADPGGDLRLRAVSARSAAVGAELEGSRFGAGELPLDEVFDVEALPAAVRGAAERIGANAVLLLPVWIAGRPAASLELMRDGDGFSLEETTLARVAAAQLALALVALGDRNGSELAQGLSQHVLGLAGEALSAGHDAGRIAEQIAYLAVEATGAVGAELWHVTPEGGLEQLVGSSEGEASLRAARGALDEQRAVSLARDDTLPQAGTLVSVRLGIPPLGVLQLSFAGQAPPSEALLGRLGTFGVRAAHALRAADKASQMSADLERTQALLAVVGQAIAQLSLAHTLETAANRITELLGVTQVAVYLRDEGPLHAAYEHNVTGPHATVAGRLLDLALGPFRAQGMLHVTDAAADLRLATVRDAVREAGIEAVVAVPLLIREDLIGLVAVYLPLGHVPSDRESTLLSALATQLAVAVQNARLHERVKRLAAEREQALDAQEARGRQLSALHDIASSFASSLSLEATLDAVVRAAVELLDADAAVIRVPDSRGDQLIPRAIHVAAPQLGEALRPLLERPQPAERLPGRRLFRMGRALVLDPGSAKRLGASYELLVPFLEQGATAAVIPIATPAELLATLTVVSLDPQRRLGPEEVDTALVVAGQAALAIDNARLYQQQKGFADTMQRRLLPQELPTVNGLELGAVYESSARVDVGGDVYDFLTLPDGRLAAALGDVMGHGIEATADMALAKFVFRSLAREHPEPGDFLAHANDVVHEEVAGGKFITMLYLALDPGRDEVAAARAGHPPARLIDPNGHVSELAPPGLALGVDPDQHYEEVRAPFAPGATVCLYTDGIVEARREEEQYGEARLDAALAAGAHLTPQALAEHVVADCRAFAGGDLVDDCAIVIVRRR